MSTHSFGRAASPRRRVAGKVTVILSSMMYPTMSLHCADLTPVWTLHFKIWSRWIDRRAQNVRVVSSSIDIQSTNRTRFEHCITSTNQHYFPRLCVSDSLPVRNYVCSYDQSMSAWLIDIVNTTSDLQTQTVAMPRAFTTAHFDSMSMSFRDINAVCLL